MNLNKGYSSAKCNKESDEQFTPYYAVEPLIKYLPKNIKVWLPFDQEWSAFNVVLKNHGFNTICSHIDNGQDFFNYEPYEWDMIISNPPFSMKDKVIERVYELGKPFCLLLPLASLQGKKRFPYFQKGLQLLTFDKRISYHNKNSLDKTISNIPYTSAYFIGGGGCYLTI